MPKGEFQPYERLMVKHPRLRPRYWKWQDILDQLQAREGESASDRARIVGLLDPDTGELSGTTPGLFVGCQLIRPGEVVAPHRHTSVAINWVAEGAGYSVIDGERIDWERGDFFVSPAFSWHEHHNPGTEPAILLTVQDLPLLSALRSLVMHEVGRPEAEHWTEPPREGEG